MSDDPRPGGWAGWLYRRAENILALMLAMMFAAFLIQIAFRYLLHLPTGWTSELSALLWIWLVLFGAAFVTRESEEIRFDIFFAAASPGARRVMLVISGLVLLVLYGGSLPAVISYVRYMKVESTAYMKIPFDWAYSIYIVFAVAMIARYVWLCGQAIHRRRAPSAEHKLPEEDI